MLAAGPARQGRLVGRDHPAVAYLGTIYEAMLEASSGTALQGPIFRTTSALLDHLRLQMGYDLAEQVRVLYLTAENRLLRDELVVRGSISEAPLYPREIMRRALELGAAAIIVAHNHPSGNPAPSKQDIQVTRRLVEAARVFEITVHDHIVVSRSGWTSLRSLGLM